MNHIAQDQRADLRADLRADPRWAALLARDADWDGRFCFGVRSTGVYCRPSCTARHPKPGNVAFFADPAAAEAAGFRPCLRCRPDGDSPRAEQAARVAKACRLIEEAEEVPDLATLAAAVGLSPHHFHRVFRRVTGLTPRGFAQAHRAGRVRAELRDGGSVTGAIYAAGFNAASRFYEKADAMLGMTPSAFRAGGPGAEIRFALGECSLGHILVARSERGICAITLGDDPEALLRDLEDRFPRAKLVGGDPGFESLVAEVVGLVEQPGRGLDLPLDLRGTAFQQRVWEALRAIPAGETLSYAALAARLGLPGAARAVGAACGANPVAVAIPCHRVVRADGGLSGYRWGLARKRALLDREVGSRGAVPDPAGGEAPRTPRSVSARGG